MPTALRPTTTDPSYQTRQSAFLGPLTAGSGGTTVNKFVAHANLLLFDITTFQVTAGTSTYTNTVTGVGTSVRPSAGLAHACHALASQRACRAAFGSRAPVQEEAEFVLWRAAKRTAEI